MTTTNLGLSKPARGALAWNTDVNGNMDLIDAVFAAAGGGTSVGMNVGSGKTLDVAGTANFTDSGFYLRDNGDTTKKLQLQLSGITTGTTRTWTAPDVSDTFVGLTVAQTLTNKSLTSPTWTGTVVANADIMPTDNTYALGDGSHRFTNLYASGSLVANNVALAGSGGFSAITSAPFLQLKNTGSGSDVKDWRFVVSGASLLLQLYGDSGSPVSNGITLTRTTTSLTGVTIASTAALTYGGVTFGTSPTGTGNPVLQTSPTISGHPTIEGITSTGATGTGKLVFDASPTISGHPTLEGITSTGATGTGNLVFSAAPSFSGTFTSAGLLANFGTAGSTNVLSVLNGANSGNTYSAIILDGNSNVSGSSPGYIFNLRLHGVDSTYISTRGFLAASSSTDFGIQCGGSGGVYLGSGATAWAAISDEKSKENVLPIYGALEKLGALRTVTGNYRQGTFKKNDYRRRSFLIAQDVLDVLPEAVDTSDPNQLGLDYTATIPLIIAAINELNGKVNNLQLAA